jgi:hypothetical protein
MFKKVQPRDIEDLGSTARMLPFTAAAAKEA